MQMQPCQSFFPAEPGSAEYRNASSFVSKAKPPWAWRMVRVPATNGESAGDEGRAVWFVFGKAAATCAVPTQASHAHVCAEAGMAEQPSSSSSGSRVVHEPGRADRMVYCSSARGGGALRSLQMQNVTAIRI